MYSAVCFGFAKVCNSRKQEALPQAFAFKSHCTVDHPATKRWLEIYAKEK